MPMVVIEIVVAVVAVAIVIGAVDTTVAVCRRGC